MVNERYQKIINDLIHLGKEMGSLSTEVVIDELSEFDIDIEGLESIFDLLKNEGIRIEENHMEEEDDDDIPEPSDEEIVDPYQDMDIELDVKYTVGELGDSKTNDPVKTYLREIGRVPLLTAEEEIDLAKLVTYALFAKEQLKSPELLTEDEILEYEEAIERGEKAKNRLVESNLRLVVSVAKRHRGRGMAFLDLIQEGNIGLIKAVDKYDYTKGFRFSTYATWWIRQAITRSIADQARTIRIPVHMIETINKLIKAKRKLVQDLGRDPSNEELANELGVTEDKVGEIMRINQDTVSLETPVGSEEDSSLGDFIADDTTLSPDEFTSNELLKQELSELLETLSDREERVLILRFGLNGERVHTLEEVGREFGVTRERIRQIESKAIKKLKHPTRSRRLKDFHEDL